MCWSPSSKMDYPRIDSINLESFCHWNYSASFQMAHDHQPYWIVCLCETAACLFYKITINLQKQFKLLSLHRFLSSSFLPSSNSFSIEESYSSLKFNFQQEKSECLTNEVRIVPFNVILVSVGLVFTLSNWNTFISQRIPHNPNAGTHFHIQNNIFREKKL